MRISISVWSINWWLRFTGFRIFVQVQPTEEEEGDMQARIGVMWWGSPFLDERCGWYRVKKNV